MDVVYVICSVIDVVYVICSVMDVVYVICSVIDISICYLQCDGCSICYLQSDRCSICYLLITYIYRKKRLEIREISGEMTSLIMQTACKVAFHYYIQRTYQSCYFPCLTQQQFHISIISQAKISWNSEAILVLLQTWFFLCRTELGVTKLEKEKLAADNRKVSRSHIIILYAVFANLILLKQYHID